MTDEEARRLQTLERRARHLHARIVAAEPRRLDYDEAELSALRWAIDIIHGALDSEPVRDGGQA